MCREVAAAAAEAPSSARRPEDGTRRCSPGSGGGEAAASLLPLPACQAACERHFATVNCDGLLASVQLCSKSCTYAGLLHLTTRPARAPKAPCRHLNDWVHSSSLADEGAQLIGCDVVDGWQRIGRKHHLQLAPSNVCPCSTWLLCFFSWPAQTAMSGVRKTCTPHSRIAAAPARVAACRERCRHQLCAVCTHVQCLQMIHSRLAVIRI
jgi:hypothetical protein